MGAKQRIKIGDTLIESSREFPWETIKELAKYLKRIARWDPEQKIWIISWRIFSRIDEFISFINKKLIYVDQVYAYRLLEVIEKLMGGVPKSIIDNENDMIYLLVIGEDPYEIVKQVDRGLLPIRLVERSVSINDIGEIPVMYLAIKLSRVYEIMDSRAIDKLPLPLREALMEAIPERPKQIVRIRVTKRNRIIIRIPKPISEELINEIKELGTIRYYVESAEGGYEERIIDAYKIFERGGCLDIYLPPFAAGFVEEVLEKYGFEVDVDYQLPEQKLDYLKENFKLYPHQLQALMKWVENGNKGTIVFPTGGGKTIVAIAAIVRLKVPTIIFVPNLWLLNQWREKIAQFAGVLKHKIGVLGGGEKDIKDITVATYQSGVKNIEILSGRFWLVIYDECHHVPARTFRRVAMNLRAPYKMALSATPKRRDKNEVLLFKLAGNIVYSITYSELVRQGLVAPMVYRRIYVPLPPEKILEYHNIAREVDLETNELKRKQLINRMIAVAQENPTKIEVIKAIVEKHRNEKIFIFAPTIRFAKQIAREVNKIAPAVALTAETSRSEEERIVRKFKACILQVLVIIRKAEEGVDIGDASVAIIVGGSKQEREFIQRVGRVLRLDPQKTKVAWVYELVSENTVEESMAKKRGGLKLVREIADYVIKKYGIPAIRKIRWEPGVQID